MRGVRARGRMVTSPEARRVGLRFENIDKRYGGLYALRRVSLEIAPREGVAFAGRNGSGKTTLLRVVAQLVRPSAGEVEIFAAAKGIQRGAQKKGVVGDPPEGF